MHGSSSEEVVAHEQNCYLLGTHNRFLEHANLSPDTVTFMERLQPQQLIETCQFQVAVISFIKIGFTKEWLEDTNGENCSLHFLKLYGFESFERCMAAWLMLSILIQQLLRLQRVISQRNPMICKVTTSARMTLKVLVVILRKLFGEA